MRARDPRPGLEEAADSDTDEQTGRRRSGDPSRRHARRVTDRARGLAVPET